MSFKKRYERRFTGKIINLTLWQSITGFLRGRGWVVEKFVFIEIKPDSPDYENAPYAEEFIW
jgi:hypothetical protein